MTPIEQSADNSDRPSACGSLRIAAVSYLNTAPLVFGLADRPEVQLTRLPPAQLAARLVSGEADVALMPVIDICKSPVPLTILTAGCIASAGPTLTVRVFSRVAAEDITQILGDTESHTSIVLARLLWRRRFDRQIKVSPFDARGHAASRDAQAVLLIGDKTVAAPPAGFDVQIDLGEMWHEQTRLPFVFAVWAARADCDVAAAWRLLADARSAGQRSAAQLAHQLAPQVGWDEQTAARYLTQYMQYEFTAAHRSGLELFLKLAAEAGLAEQPRELDFYGD